MIKNLKSIRKQMKITQKEIAQKLNIDYTTYGRYENGQTEPTLDTLIKISKILNTSVDTLLDINNNSNITNQQKELINIFEQLPNLEQNLVLDYAKKALEIVKLTKEKELKNKLNNKRSSN